MYDSTGLNWTHGFEPIAWNPISDSGVSGVAKVIPILNKSGPSHFTAVLRAAAEAIEGASASLSSPELSVVIPFYNEAAIAAAIVEEAATELEAHGIDYEILAYDDGSRDATLEQLCGLQRIFPRLRVLTQSNRGHGPTLLRGYREASGVWVLQVDGDGEVSWSAFGEAWNEREQFDFAVGSRQGRRETAARWLLSRLTVRIVRGLFGGAFSDPNCPFRLMRREALQLLTHALPEDTFAPNVLLSGLAQRAGLQVREFKVRFRPRQAGRSSLVSWNLVRGAWKALRQTLSLGLRGRRGGRLVLPPKS